MNTFVVGSTGFLGYFAVRELLARGHNVRSISLHPAPPELSFPSSVELVLGDLNATPDDTLREMLHGMDGLIFAAGLDDRVVPKAPAYPKFYEANVAATRRLIRLGKEAGIKKAIVFSSYFVACHRRWPELRLPEHHPYIRSRVEQISEALEEAGDEMAVSFLMLPYIFGSLPGKTPLWKPLIGYLNSILPWAFYPAGGSAMVTADEVGRAAVRALEVGRSGEEWPIASDNLTWVEFLGRIGKILGKPKRVITLPNWLLKPAMAGVELGYKFKGKESGLSMVPFVDLQTRNAFLDTEYSRTLLGYEKGNLDQVLADTVKACLPKSS